MININNYITKKLFHQQMNEKLVINKDSKLSDIKVDIYGKHNFTNKEIDEIINFANSLKIKPIIVTNKSVVPGQSKLENSNEIVFLHFYDKWEKISPYAYAGYGTGDHIICIRFSTNNKGNYYCNCINDKGQWLYSGHGAKSSIYAVIDFMKTELKKKFKDYLE